MSGGGSDDDATNFDLTALMDVLSNIIFFLMASFGAAVVAGLPASVPTISEAGDSDVARDEQKVTLTLQVKGDGTVESSVANNDMLPDELQPFAKTFSPKNGKTDLSALNDHLWSIKEKFRESKDVILIPEDDVTYESIVEVMDAARERHLLVNGKSAYPQMFPAVVVSSLVK